MQGKPRHAQAHTPGRWAHRDDRDGGGMLEDVRLYVACATLLYACTFNLEYTIDLYV